jgi:hypothetical protein
MPLTKVDTNVALIVIDLQKGIVAIPTIHPAAEIAARTRLTRAVLSSTRSFNLYCRSRVLNYAPPNPFHQ